MHESASHNTIVDVLSASSGFVVELIDGVVQKRRHGAPLTAIMRFNIAATLSNVSEFTFLHLPELHLKDHIAVPEVAAWRKVRLIPMPDASEDLPTPDWLCEILSPSTEMLDRNAKRRIYGEAGVAFLWLLDPRTRSLEAFQLVAGKWLLIGVAEADEPVSFAPFDAISFPLSDLFPFDAPPGLTPAAEG